MYKIRLLDKPGPTLESALFEIKFTFPERKEESAYLRVSAENLRTLHVDSLTDGYHRLQFWLAQQPRATRLVDLSEKLEEMRVSIQLFAYGFSYVPETRETAFLLTHEDVTGETIHRFAEYLHPRFALRGRLSRGRR